MKVNFFYFQENEKFMKSLNAIQQLRVTYSKIPKLEGNLQVVVYNLFIYPESRKKYELNDFRKRNLLREFFLFWNQPNFFLKIAKKYMNERLIGSNSST